MCFTKILFLNTKSNPKIILKTPIKQGERKITEISLRKPFSGELRGIKLLDVLQMDVSAYIPLLQRITTPILTETQIHHLDPVDLIQIMTGVQGFLVDADSQTEI